MWNFKACNIYSKKKIKDNLIHRIQIKIIINSNSKLKVQSNMKNIISINILTQEREIYDAAHTHAKKTSGTAPIILYAQISGSALGL